MRDRLFLPAILLFFILIMVSGCNTNQKTLQDSGNNTQTRWSSEKAQEWGSNNLWYRGANFNPSTAINQLETWQEGSFDPETIDRELGWAEDIGFNSMRVYLHHLAWQVDKQGFKSRMNEYLSIADKHGIKTIFVFFDDCWNEEYQAGKQPDPKPGIHNSGWVRDPGGLLLQYPAMMDTLEAYVKDILSTFKSDNRILLWDLYNEPGNNGLGNKSMPLLKNVFSWARKINPTQPVSAGLWNKDLAELNQFQLENSDIITYHNYENEIKHKAAIDSLKVHNRPIICTEYMARTRGSKFENIMPLLKQENIGAINWGLVSGKSNTIFEWNKPIPDGTEPKIWFHDIFRQDGSVFDPSEILLIKKITGKSE